MRKLRYDANGMRLHHPGDYAVSASKAGDDNVIANLRMEFGTRLGDYSNYEIVVSYDVFCVSEDFPDNELWFSQWLQKSED